MDTAPGVRAVAVGCGEGHRPSRPQLCVQDNYRNNPFHNFRHCFCVAQMMYSMIWLCRLQVGPHPPGPTAARVPPTGAGPPGGGHTCSLLSNTGEVPPAGHPDPDDSSHLPRPGPPGLQQHVRATPSSSLALGGPQCSQPLAPPSRERCPCVTPHSHLCTHSTPPTHTRLHSGLLLGRLLAGVGGGGWSKARPGREGGLWRPGGRTECHRVWPHTPHSPDPSQP